MQNNDLTPAQRQLESALKSVAPKSVRVDAVAAAYAAGRRSARRQARFWQVAAALLFLATSVSWLAPARHAADVAINYSASSPVEPRHPSPVRPFSNQSLFVLQATVQAKGIDALPPTDVPAVQSVQPVTNF